MWTWVRLRERNKYLSLCVRVCHRVTINVCECAGVSDCFRMSVFVCECVLVCV